MIFKYVIWAIKRIVKGDSSIKEEIQGFIMPIEIKIERFFMDVKFRKKIEKLNLTDAQASYMRRYLKQYPHFYDIRDFNEFTRYNRLAGYDEFYDEYHGSMITVYHKDNIYVDMLLSFDVNERAAFLLEPYVLFSFDSFHIRVSLRNPIFVLHRKKEIYGVDPYIEKIIEIMNDNYYEFVAYFNARIVQFGYRDRFISKRKIVDKIIDSYDDGKPYYDELRKKKFKVEKPVY